MKRRKRISLKTHEQLQREAEIQAKFYDDGVVENALDDPFWKAIDDANEERKLEECRQQYEKEKPE